MSSLIVSSNKTFSAWAEIFGDAVAVEAMVDRLIHHSHVHVLKGDSYRLRGKSEEVITTENSKPVRSFQPADTAQISAGCFQR